MSDVAKVKAEETKQKTEIGIHHLAVDLIETPQAYLLCLMGSFSPSDKKLGSVISVPKNETGATKILLKDLCRPVDMDVADLNLDGYTDIITCEYGK